MGRPAVRTSGIPFIGLKSQKIWSGAPTALNVKNKNVLNNNILLEYIKYLIFTLLE